MGGTHSEIVPKFVSNADYLQQSDCTDNGLYFCDIYIPEEIVHHILSFVEPKVLLSFSRVCRKWNKLIKSYSLWSTIYKRKYGRKIKKLPWYLYYCRLCTNYFDTNLIQNGNGEEQFKHWQIKANGGDGFAIEIHPIGADPLPENIREFNNKTSCFVTSYTTCHKSQTIELGKNKLFKYILKNYKPHIYLSEWTAGRVDCNCIYRLYCAFEHKKKIVNVKGITTHCVSKWKKIEISIRDYPDEFDDLIFGHIGKDTEYWAGHYGSKMAGGVVKILFDSLDELPTNKKSSELPNLFSKMHSHDHNTAQTDVLLDELPLDIWYNFDIYGND